MECNNTVRAKPRAVTYDYTDAEGNLLFQTVRFEDDHKPGRVEDRGGWTLWPSECPSVLFNLPALVQAGGTMPVLVVEDERDAVLLKSLNRLATCSPQRRGKPWSQYVESLHGAMVGVIEYQDKAGRRHAKEVLASLAGVAAKTARIRLESGVREWIAAGGDTRELLLALHGST